MIVLLILLGLNSVLGTGLRDSVTNPHLNRENNHNLSNDCRLGANSTQATSGSGSGSTQSQVHLQKSAEI